MAAVAERDALVTSLQAALLESKHAMRKLTDSNAVASQRERDLSVSESSVLLALTICCC
jgi:hypothetical protein